MLVLVYSICYVCLRTFVGHVLLLIAYTTWSIRHFWDLSSFKPSQCKPISRAVFFERGHRATLSQMDWPGQCIKISKYKGCCKIWPNMKNVKQLYIYNHWESLNEYSNIFEYQFPAPATALFLQPRVSSILRSSQSNKVPTCSNKHAGPKAAVVYECNLRKQSLAPTVLQSQKSTAHHKTTELDHRLEVMTKNTLMTGEIHPRPA